MNNDLISRKALVREILALRDRIPRNWKVGEWLRGGLHKALRCVETAPAVDAEPVRYGKWIPNGDDDMDAGMWHCSECGHEIYTDLSLIEEIQEQGYALYCEHCGAKMEGGRNE